MRESDAISLFESYIVKKDWRRVFLYMKLDLYDSPKYQIGLSSPFWISLAQVSFLVV
jgi:hypothetical protein